MRCSFLFSKEDGNGLRAVAALGSIAGCFGLMSLPSIGEHSFEIYSIKSEKHLGPSTPGNIMQQSYYLKHSPIMSINTLLHCRELALGSRAISSI